MAREEIVAEVKARASGPPDYSPLSFGWRSRALQPPWLCAPMISPLSILKPVKVCHTRPVTEFLGVDKFPAARAGFILGRSRRKMRSP
jgi:hypothetical protein